MNYQLREKSDLKDSGVDWIAEVPNSWIFKPLKFSMRASDERVRDYPNFNLALSVSGYRGVEPRNVKTNDGQCVSEDTGVYRIVRKGQLVVNTMWLNYKGLGISQFDGFVSPAYQSYFIGKQLTDRFIHYLLRSDEYVQKYSSLLYGLRPNSLQVKRHDFERIGILSPPLDEQKQIADFLDEKTAVIDEVVKKKKKQIELLKEKRSALITKAVTKGLDPNVKMKDSGVEWIGEIPEGWEIKKLKNIGYFSKGGNISKKELTDEGVPVLLYGDIYTKYDIQTKHLARCTDSETARKSSKIISGDLLFTGSGETIEDIGKNIVYLGKETAYAGGDVIIFRQDKENSLFLAYQQNGELLKIEKAKLGKGQIIVHIYASQLKNISVPIPPKSMQDDIVDYLNKKTAIIDDVIEKIKKSIKLIQEYRSSLISHAVTGKIVIEI